MEYHIIIDEDSIPLEERIKFIERLNSFIHGLWSSQYQIPVKIVDHTNFPFSVTLADIDKQRELGWPDFHPEDFCHRCGGKNLNWFVDSDRFNLAMGQPDVQPFNGIVCPGCFVTLHEEMTRLTCMWKLVPYTNFKPKENDGNH